MDILGTITGGIDYSKEPLEAAADLTVNAMGEELNILALLEDVDGSAVISYSVDGGQTWESEELGEMDVNLEIDPIELLENLGEAGDLVSDFTPVGAELVNGAEATRYDSALNGAALGALVEETGAEEIAEASLDMDMDMDFSGMQDVKLSVWVDNASGLPVQASIDMADAIQSIVDASLGEILAASGMTGEEGSDLSVALSQMYITVTLSNFDEVGEIGGRTGGTETAAADDSELHIGDSWEGTIDIAGHSGKGDLEDGSYGVWALLDTDSSGKLFFEIYDIDDEDASESAILSFWAVIDGNRIVPVIGDQDAWLINIYLDESDADELTFVLEDSTLTASYFYYDSDESEACDVSFNLYPVD